jgi:hypothetical protein
MKVENMKDETGKPIANQFIITTTKMISVCDEYEEYDVKYFQSDGSIIAYIIFGFSHYIYKNTVHINAKKWGEGSSYLSKFLCETKEEIKSKIISGEYTLDHFLN